MARVRYLWVVPVCMILALYLMPGTACAEGDASSKVFSQNSDMEITVSNGLLSVQLKNAGLLQVMQELSRQSGIRIKLDKGASKRITLTFRDMPFDKGIRNLIRPLNYAMIWRKTKDKQGVEMEVLEELRIFREGHQGGTVLDLRPDETPESSGSKVQKRVWSEETRARMLEKLRVAPSAP
jgi:hypothetical protein